MRALAALLLSTAAGTVAAQVLHDPTQPPASVLQPQEGASAVPAGPVASKLQSILVSRKEGGRRVALIDGQALRVGEKYKNAVVVRISETEVVLREGKIEEVLKLFPDVDAKAASSAKQNQERK